jgi:potassium voltage-gated channel Eag-related subfamily H protein 5
MKTLEETLNLREKYSVIMDLAKLIFFYIFVSHLIACAWHFVGMIEMNYG